jgi:FlaA1/EpsC-like NDP-sugar epimerase
MKNIQLKKDNIFLKLAYLILKVLVLFILAYLFVGLFFVQNTIQLAIGFFIVIFITLPTLFIFFFKEKFLAKYPKFTIFWKIIRIIYIISIILFIFSTSFGLYRSYEKDKTNSAIVFINSKKITLDDVMGKNLPPQPDQKLNDSTIAGIDANKNYIRDDVELAIFKKYPNSAKIRAAELQYAQVLQLELTQVFNSKTLIATMQKQEHAFACLGYSGLDKNLSVVIGKENEIKNFVLDIDSRKKEYSSIFEKYMAGYESSSGNECDVNL